MLLEDKISVELKQCIDQYGLIRPAGYEHTVSHALLYALYRLYGRFLTVEEMLEDLEMMVRNKEKPSAQVSRLIPKILFEENKLSCEQQIIIFVDTANLAIHSYIFIQNRLHGRINDYGESELSNREFDKVFR